MCDTLAIRDGGATWFAKNSDREPDEPQVVEVVPPVRGDPASTLRVTYISLDQAPDRHGIIISRPDWMWGAEMGVNDRGVAIGNEAVFSKCVDKSGTALLGMDLVRLGLERGSSAREALRIITELLELHGQAGPAGFRDKRFRYDNSYLIADPREAWVLETARRNWAARRIAGHWAISNTYTIRGDYDLASAGLGAVDFKAGFERRGLRSWLARGGDRIALSKRGVCSAVNDGLTLSALANTLRSHRHGDGFAGGSNRDVCMHAGGLLRPSQTTGSMIARLVPGELPQVAVTGTSAPCVSLFRPVQFGWQSETLGAMADGRLWRAGQDLVARAKADAVYRATVRAEIVRLEPELLRLIEAGGHGNLDKAAAIVDEWMRSVIGVAAKSESFRI